MRVAVTGTTGRVGAALATHFARENHEVVPLPRRDFDLEKPASLAAALGNLKCDVFLNPAGLTSLEACEEDPELARRINSEAPAEIAEWGWKNGVKLVHFSTDYVFAGETPGLRAETETPCPLNVYGRSKLAGEQAVLAVPGNCVVRVSWVFGPERPSFVDSIFDRALAGLPLAAVADKFSLPVFTTDLASWLEGTARDATGVLHACNSGEPVSWHGLATAVVAEMHATGTIPLIPEIREQASNDMPSFQAKRPRFTALDTGRLAALLGKPPRPWREALAEHVRQRCSALRRE